MNNDGKTPVSTTRLKLLRNALIAITVLLVLTWTVAVPIIVVRGKRTLSTTGMTTGMTTGVTAGVTNATHTIRETTPLVPRVFDDGAEHWVHDLVGGVDVRNETIVHVVTAAGSFQSVRVEQGSSLLVDSRVIACTDTKSSALLASQQTVDRLESELRWWKPFATKHMPNVIPMGVGGVLRSADLQ